MDIGAAWRIVDQGGSDLTERLRPHLIRISIQDRAGLRADQLTLTFRDGEQLELPATAKKLTISLGVPLVEVGAYFIDPITASGPPPVLTITGQGVHFGGGSDSGEAPALSDESQDRVYESTTLGDIAQAVAARLGVSAAVSDEAGSFPVEYEEQRGESDLSFISRLAKRAGAIAKVNADALSIGSVHTFKSLKSGEKMFDAALRPSDIVQYSASWKSRNAPAKIVARYHDFSSDKTGVVSSGEGTPKITLPVTYSNQSVAQRAAESALDARVQKRRKMSLTLRSVEPRLGVGATVTLSAKDFRPGVAGTWSIREATHSVGDGRSSTQLQVESKTAA